MTIRVARMSAVTGRRDPSLLTKKRKSLIQRMLTHQSAGSAISFTLLSLFRPKYLLFRIFFHTFSLIPFTLSQRVKMSEGAHSGNTYSTGDNQFHRALSSTASTNHGLYGDLPPEMGGPSSSGPSPSSGLFSSSLASKLGLPLMPNPAPDVDLSAPLESPAASSSTTHSVEFAHPGGVDSELPSSSSEPKRKKYAKEAWPGRKPTPSLLI